MAGLTQSAYLVLQPTYQPWGDRPVNGFRIIGLRANKPALKSGEVAIKVKLRIDSSVFEQYIPLVTAEIEGPDIITAPRVEVLPADTGE